MAAVLAPPPRPALQVDKLLVEVAALPAGTEPADIPALAGRTNRLERVAGEVSRLSFQANRGKVRWAGFCVQRFCFCVVCVCD